MSPVIPQTVLEEIRINNDIVTVISSYFNLQKSGVNFKTLCPFHKEKTPSFTVNPQRQIYHCFGCDTGGDVFKFVMEYEKVDFVTAVKMLAQRAGIRITLEKGTDSAAERKDVLYEINEKVARLYQNILWKSTQGKTARAYLKSRDFPETPVRDFMIGYAPDCWDTVLEWARQKYQCEQLESVGLVIASQKQPDGTSTRAGKQRWYDRFRDRLMFPVRDTQGRIVGFSGRTLQADAGTAKYVNTPETILFHKGRILYGLYAARRNIVESREAIVCEGQMDVIRCHLNGFKNAVAPQGTAFTEDHARILKRYADSAVLVFDADRAGQDAALRVSETFFRTGTAVRIGSLPSGEDPDSLLRGADGKKKFEGILDKSKSAVDFLIDILSARETIDTEKGMMRVAASALAMISRASSAIQQDWMLQRAALRLGLPEEALRRDLRKLSGQSRSEGNAVSDKRETSKTFPMREVALVEHLVADLSFIPMVREYLPLEMITDETCRKMIQLCLDSGETGTDIMSLISERDNEDRSLVQFASMVMSSPVKVKGVLSTNEESVKSLILALRRGALQERKKKIAEMQRLSRTGIKKLSASEEKKIELESCQLSYDIARFQSWESALPIMEVMGKSDQEVIDG